MMYIKKERKKKSIQDWVDPEWINEVPMCIEDVLTLEYCH